MHINVIKQENITVDVTPEYTVDCLCEYYFNEFNCWKLVGDKLIKEIDTSYHGSQYFEKVAEITDPDKIELYKTLIHLKELIKSNFVKE